jgi:hypothetical protein
VNRCCRRRTTVDTNLAVCRDCPQSRSSLLHPRLAPAHFHRRCSQASLRAVRAHAPLRLPLRCRRYPRTLAASQAAFCMPLTSSLVRRQVTPRGSHTRPSRPVVSSDVVANEIVASAYASEQATDNMSASPPKQEGVEPVQSPDEEQPMDRNTEDVQAQNLGYEFEVKEQDRWLPIANGTSISLAFSRAFDLRIAFAPTCTSTDCSNGRLWMPTDSPLARLCVESRNLVAAASHSASLCA